MKLCHINGMGPVFFETRCTCTMLRAAVRLLFLAALQMFSVVHFCRAMICYAYMPSCGVSVRPSVHLSRSYILSKRINISSIFFNRRIASPF